MDINILLTSMSGLQKVTHLYRQLKGKISTACLQLKWHLEEGECGFLAFSVLENKRDAAKLIGCFRLATRTIWMSRGQAG